MIRTSNTGSEPRLFALAGINSISYSRANLDSARLRGYFVDKDLNFYSNKSSIIATKLSTTTATFAGGYQKQLIRNFLEKDIVFNTWLMTVKREMGITGVNQKIGGEDRVFAIDATHGATNGGVIIGQISPGGELTLSKEPKIHMTEDSYKSEMARLAKQFPGTRFVAFKAVTSVIAQDLMWA